MCQKQRNNRRIEYETKQSSAIGIKLGYPKPSREHAMDYLMSYLMANFGWCLLGAFASGFVLAWIACARVPR